MHRPRLITADCQGWHLSETGLNRIDRIRPEYRESLREAGYKFPDFRHIRIRNKVPYLPQPETAPSP